MKKARGILFAAAALVAACSKPADPPVASAAKATATASAAASATTSATAARTPAIAPGHPAGGIAWRRAASDAEVEAAFAQARAEKKPVFVYWGAEWCPPCNQLKATLFNRVDFIERSRAFVPVYIDGDSPGAQKLGTRFKVRGYPTLLLFNTDGTELTRLPGEVDAAQYTQLLTLGMSAQRPVKAVLADAQQGGRGLTPNDWKLLAFYSWETDEQQLVPKAQVPALLKQLAAACPADQDATATRLLLKAVAAAGAQPARPPAAGQRARPPDPPARARVLALLADARAARSHMDVLTNNAADITRALSAAGTPERARLAQAFDAALAALQSDTTLSRADRMTALYARVELARIGRAKDDARAPVLPAALLADVREQAARADREITDGYERQAVVTLAADLLETAGLPAESDALLKANLAKSHSPYYLMSGLAANARKRGDAEEALRWSQQAFDQAEGPATRLQWGASHVALLVELAPRDEPRIEQAVGRLFAEAAAQPDAFHERSGRSLQRVGSTLTAWNQRQSHAAVLQRLQSQLDSVCATLPAQDPQRGVCDGLLKAPAERAKTRA
jgi:thioredoxin-like negative regulator of GroEL